MTMYVILCTKTEERQLRRTVVDRIGDAVIMLFAGSYEKNKVRGRQLRWRVVDRIGDAVVILFAGSYEKKTKLEEGN